MSGFKWVYRVRATLWFLPVLILTACGGDGGPMDPGEGDYFIKAVIDGEAWSAPSQFVIANPSSAVPGSLFFQGSTLGNPARGLAFALGRITGPGQYPLGMNPGTGSGGTGTYTFGTQAYTTPLAGVAGGINITGIDAEAVTGTFQMTVNPIVGGEDPVTITNGEFRVPLSQGFTAVPLDQRGNSVSLTMGGANIGSFVGGTIVAEGEPETLIVAVANNGIYTVTLSISNVSEAGTLPLQPGIPMRRVSVQRNGEVGRWGASDEDVGTFTITSVTASRIQGTFSGTLAPSVGASGDLVVTNGMFDLLLP